MLRPTMCHALMNSGRRAPSAGANGSETNVYEMGEGAPPPTAHVAVEPKLDPAQPGAGSR